MNRTGAEKGPSRPGGKLFRRYLLAMLSLVSIALLASGGISLYFSYQDNKAALASLQIEKAVAAAARIEQFTDRIARQFSLAALPQLDAADNEARRIEFVKLLRQMPEVTDIALLDGDGRELNLVSRLAMDVSGSLRDRRSEAAFVNAGRGTPWFSPVYFRKQTEPYLTVSLRSGRGPKPAVAIAEVNLKFVWDVVSRIKVGAQGKAYVVDASGDLIADPDIGLVLRRTNLAGLAQVGAASAAQPADRSVMVATNLAGAEVLTAMAAIDSLGWRVFVEQPVAEVYAGLQAAIARTALLLVAGLVASALAASALARSMVRPIRALQEGAARAAAGDLGHRIAVVRSGDELEALAGEFNRMAAVIATAHAGLEAKVADRTAELGQALAQQTAIADLVKAMSRTSFQLDAVLHALIENAIRLCQADKGFVYLREGEDYLMRVNHGSAPGQVDTRPLRPAMGTLVGRTALLCQPVAIVDAVNDSSYTWKEAQQRLGFRSMLGVPMLRDGEPIGVIAMWRCEVRPFSDNDQRLVTTFADQAVIAIENARLFEQLAAKTRQLEITSRHKSEFLANMSHELRTPLNAVIGFSEVLIEQMFGPVNAKQLEYLHDIHSSGEHLLTLINEVLDLSKVEAGRMELELGEVDLGELLDHALALVRERAARNGLTLKLDIAAALPTWVADSRKIKQVLLNLLSNAVKFTPAGGSVTLRAACPDADAVEIAVIDTGVGIAAADQVAVFEAFRQASGSYLRKAEGTGLGLALARRFVELHGGTLSLQSAIGQGSTFTFTLPARKLDAP
jgi:signal transduction histidine kinase